MEIDHRKKLIEMADHFNKLAPKKGAEPAVRYRIKAPDNSSELNWDEKQRRFVVRSLSSDQASGIKEGDRVRLLSMPDDPDPVPAGTEGTVTFVSGPHTLGPHQEKKFIQVGVRWDNGRTLSPCVPPDIVEVVR